MSEYAICKDMNGNRCAESHCDFWSTEHRKCLLAVREELIVDILAKLNMILQDFDLPDSESVNEGLKDAVDVAEKLRKLIK